MSLWSRLKQRFGSTDPAPQVAPAPPAGESPGAPTIGVAWMEKNGTVYVRIRLEEGDRIGDVNLTYPKRHPRYRAVVACLGGIRPGEAKPITHFDPSPEGARTGGNSHPAR
jgi:hypothetical protein